MATHHHPPETIEQLITHRLHIAAPGRQPKDIATWRQAIVAAEHPTQARTTGLYDLYEDILLDAHLSGIIAKRMDAVLNKELYCTDASGMRLPEWDGLLTSLAMRTLVGNIMECLLWGVSGIEFVPDRVLNVVSLPRKHLNTQKRIITFTQNGTEGFGYEHHPLLWIIESPQRQALLMKCAPYCLYKRNALADWAEYIELFGQPVRIVRYDSYDEHTKAEIRTALQEAGSALAMMIPRQADFELKDGKQSNGDGSLQLSFITAMNNELSVLILGNTNTTTTAPGSGYAQSKIHLDQQYEITKSDLAYVQAMLNSPKCLHALSLYGYNLPPGGCLSFAKEKDLDYLSQRIAIDTAVAAHAPLPASYWYKTYGINPNP